MKAFARIFTFLILLATAGCVFYFGWIQYKVKPDTCGVLISKTGGVYEKPVVPGVFSWRFEPLLPTNAQLRVFSLSPYTVVKTINGKLPSADIYSLQLKQSPDFTYSFSFRLSIRFTPQGVVSCVKKANIQNDTQLNTELDILAAEMAKLGASAILDKSKDSSITIFSAGAFDFESVLADFCKENQVELLSFTVDSAQCPDMALYAIAKQSFSTYRSAVDSELQKSAAGEALNIAQDDRNIRRLEKMGELLRKYPELSDVIKSGASVEKLQSLKNLE